MNTKEKLADEYAEKHGFRIPYDGSDIFYDDVDVKASYEGFIAGFNAASSPEQLLPVIKKVFGSGAAKGCAERLRQIQVEGWTPENDDQYDGGELAKASASYILPEEWRQMIKCTWRKVVPCFFPRWNLDWWKPTPNNRSRDLEKGIALGMAEIDRLKRKEESK